MVSWKKEEKEGREKFWGGARSLNFLLSCFFPSLFLSACARPEDVDNIETTAAAHANPFELSLLFGEREKTRSSFFFFRFRRRRANRSTDVQFAPFSFSFSFHLPNHSHLQARVRGQALLPEQPLRLAVELLDHLAREQAGRLDLHPAADAEAHQAELERRGLVRGPPGGRGEVPPG